MSGKNIIFDDNKISKSNFYRNKKLYSTYDIEIDKILISNQEYFLGYNNDNVIRSFLDFYKDILVHVILLTTFSYTSYVLPFTFTQCILNLSLIFT